MSKPVKLDSIDQIAVVVRDLDAAMSRYAKELGIGPWDVYTYGPQRLWKMTYRGVEQPYAMKLGLAFVGPTMYELIEPLDQGATIYQEFLDERGEGLHHLGYYVADIDDAIAEMEARGYPVLQSGRGFRNGPRRRLRLLRYRIHVWLHRRSDRTTQNHARARICRRHTVSGSSEASAADSLFAVRRRQDLDKGNGPDLSGPVER